MEDMSRSQESKYDVIDIWRLHVIGKFLYEMIKINLTCIHYIPHCHKTFEYKFCITPKSSNQSTGYIGYSVLIGCLSSMSTKIQLKSFITAWTRNEIIQVLQNDNDVPDKLLIYVS
jgi:hypothetical protein